MPNTATGRGTTVIVMALAACVAAPAVALTQRTQKPLFSSSTTSVRVDVLVTDHNKPIAGLAPGDFELRDNGVPQKITSIESSDVPINVVLAFDTSDAP